MLIDNTILAKKVSQNNQEFFVGVFTIKQILTFTKYTERLIVSYDENNEPIYNPDIQRKVESSRVEKIANFLLDDPDAIFPTNLVIAIPNAAIEQIISLETQEYKIVLNAGVFTEIKKEGGDVFLTIIDGQHRIKGIEKAIGKIGSEIENYNKILIKSTNEEIKRNLDKRIKLLNNLLNINLVVTFFIDPTLEFQAMIFSTINRTQKSVPQSLVYSLFGLTEKDSPQKSSLQVVLALNSFSKSPFYNRVKLHGGNYERNQSPPLTQAAIVKSVIDLISTNATESERDRFKERVELKVGCNPDLPFRRYYANDEDNKIVDILFCYFSAVRNTFTYENTSLWDFDENTKPGNILQTTVGYFALLEILIDILRIENEENRRDKVETYTQYLLKAKPLEFSNQQRYPFTSISKTILYLDLSIAIWPPKSNEDVRYEKLRRALKG